jgi:hypothetical protein
MLGEESGLEGTMFGVGMMRVFKRDSERVLGERKTAGFTASGVIYWKN